MIEGELNEGQPLRSGGSSEESAGGVVCFSAAGAGAEKEGGGRLLGEHWPQLVGRSLGGTSARNTADFWLCILVTLEEKWTARRLKKLNPGSAPQRSGLQEH